jgi:hypothetical protein
MVRDRFVQDGTVARQQGGQLGRILLRQGGAALDVSKRMSRCDFAP